MVCAMHKPWPQRNRKFRRCIDKSRSWHVDASCQAPHVSDIIIEISARMLLVLYISIEFRSNYRYSVECEDRITELTTQLKASASNNPQMIMCVVSNNNSDRYGSIKKRCYCDHGIPSQVIVQKTITPKDPSKGPAGLMSVATKVAIQMNCKCKCCRQILFIKNAKNAIFCSFL